MSATFPMRGACLLMAALCLSTNALAQESSQESADRFTNADLLAQSEPLRRLWISALMVGASNALALHDAESGECLAHWFFDNEEAVYAEILTSITAYPDYLPVEVIFAHAREACPGLIRAQN